MLITTFLFTVIKLTSHCEAKNETHIFPITYIDYDDYTDFFFDRVAVIAINEPNYNQSKRNQTNISIGVFIANNRALTTYNPFRKIISDKNLIDKLVLYGLTGRVFKPRNYTGFIYTLPCGRQVSYLPDENITDSQWHGDDKQDCPVHDLMVTRLDTEFQVGTQPPSEHTKEKNYPDVKDEDKLITHHTFITTLATAEDKIGKTLKIASIGYKSHDHIKDNQFLHRTELEDNVLANCEDWLPRDWGHFICIYNTHNFPGLASGSLLTSNDKLFGLGSFVFYGNDKGILVFTDVRPYNELINEACTMNDSGQS